MTSDLYGVYILMAGSFLAGCISTLCGVMLTVAVEDWNKAKSDKQENEF